MAAESYKCIGSLFYDEGFSNEDKIQFVKKCRDREMALYRFNDKHPSSYTSLKSNRNLYTAILQHLKRNDSFPHQNKIGIMYEDIKEAIAGTQTVRVKYNKYVEFDDLYITNSDYHNLQKINGLRKHKEQAESYPAFDLPSDDCFENLILQKDAVQKYARNNKKTIAALKAMYMAVDILNKNPGDCTDANISKLMHDLLYKNKCLGFDSALRSNRNRSIANKKPPFKNIRIEKGMLLPGDTNQSHLKQICATFLPDIIALKHYK